MPYQGLEVDLPALGEVPGMLERLSEDSRKCRDYADEAFTISDWRGSRVGIINLLTGTHDRIREEVLSYFQEVWSFAAAKSERVAECVDFYHATDLATAEALDQSLWSINVQPVRDEALALGRSSDLSPSRPEAAGLEPAEPAAALKPLVDYRADMPFEPEWAGESSSIGKTRDTIWQVTSWAAELGLMDRPYDVIAELVVPFTGDWAGMKSCGDGLGNAAVAAGRLNTNAAWTARRVDAAWLGIVADAAFVEIWKLHQSLRDAPTVLEGYANAYHDVVLTIQDLERRAGEVLVELLDWAVIGITATTGRLPGIGALVWKVLPPVDLIQTVVRVYMLWDLVKQATQAIWDFEARVDVGMLHGPKAGAAMPSVPVLSDIHYHR